MVRYASKVIPYSYRVNATYTKYCTWAYNISFEYRQFAQNVACADFRFFAKFYVTCRPSYMQWNIINNFTGEIKIKKNTSEFDMKKTVEFTWTSCLKLSELLTCNKEEENLNIQISKSAIF